MAHHQKAVAAAAALNSGIFAVEAVAGYQAGSLALLMDSVHNLSDEMALVFLYLAFILPLGVSRNLLRSANVFNSVNLIGQRASIVASDRTSVASYAYRRRRSDHRRPRCCRSQSDVARLLLKPARKNAAIRLAYIHNMGDVWVSLAPVGAGLLLTLTGYPFVDPLIAAGVAVWFIASTGREIFQSHEELIWPDKIVCGHSDHDDAAVAAN